MYYWEEMKQDYAFMLMWHRNKKYSKSKWHRMNLLTKIFNKCVMEVLLLKERNITWVLFLSNEPDSVVCYSKV